MKHWKQARGPLAVMLASPLLGIGALAAEGDLVRDRHPEEPARTFSQRLYGCSGTALWKELQRKDEASLTALLAPFRMAHAPIASPLEVGRVAVHLSALAYLGPQAVHDQVQGWNLTPERVETISSGSQYALVLARDDALFVAFRGTDDAKDWIADANFTPADSLWGKVHKGFLDALDTLWPDVSIAVQHLRTANQPIWLTGHSLGGALAVLAAARLDQQGTSVAGIVTFGQPPAGYRTFAENFKAKSKAHIVRFVNHVDAVVEVVAPVAVLQLTHIGKPLYFDTAGRMHIEWPLGILQTTRDAVCAPSFESGAEFKAHHMRRYVTLLQKTAK